MLVLHPRVRAVPRGIPSNISGKPVPKSRHRLRVSSWENVTHWQKLGHTGGTFFKVLMLLGKSLVMVQCCAVDFHTGFWLVEKCLVWLNPNPQRPKIRQSCLLHFEQIQVLLLLLRLPLQA